MEYRSPLADPIGTRTESVRVPLPSRLSADDAWLTVDLLRMRIQGCPSLYYGRISHTSRMSNILPPDGFPSFFVNKRVVDRFALTRLHSYMVTHVRYDLLSLGNDDYIMASLICFFSCKYWFFRGASSHSCTHYWACFCALWHALVPDVVVGYRKYYRKTKCKAQTLSQPNLQKVK